MALALSHPQQRCQIRSSSMSVWVYFLGERTGADLKIGHTKEVTLRRRFREVNQDQMTSDSYLLLAAIHATPKDEKYVKDWFGAHRRPKGSRVEYFWPADDLVRYTAWLRSQWWSSLSLDDDLREWEMVDSEHWLPDGNGRAILPPPKDELKLIQDYEDPADELYNTPWSWFPSQKVGIQDYFTPSEIIGAADEAMGGRDLDAASHPLANRTHKFPDYFHTGRSAFHNDWHGRIWLNPPYGNNAPWFERILHEYAAGRIDQLCMLSPMWAFQTHIARPVVELASGLILLSPTPKFWGNANPNKTGVNHPHGILYIGNRAREFHRAFADFGFPMRPAWSDLGEFEPNEEAA